jgi:hypothetical protein
VPVTFPAQTVEARYVKAIELFRNDAGQQVAQVGDILIDLPDGQKIAMSQALFEALAPDAEFDPATGTYSDPA